MPPYPVQVIFKCLPNPVVLNTSLTLELLFLNFFLRWWAQSQGLMHVGRVLYSLSLCTLTSSEEWFGLVFYSESGSSVAQAGLQLPMQSKEDALELLVFFLLSPRC